MPRKVKNIPNDVRIVGPLDDTADSTLPFELMPKRHSAKVNNIRLTEIDWRRLSTIAS